MPIKGLTDQTAAFPIIGVLRKGDAKTDEKKPGKDLTYFRFTTDDDLARKQFQEAYPDTDARRAIHVFLPHQTAAENFEAWIEEWVAGGLVHRCDGETQVLWKTDTGVYSTERRTCNNCKGKQVGRLSVIIPELGRLATVTVLTTSKHDILNLDKQLRSYEALRGDLRGIPFVLRRREKEISTPSDEGSKRVRRKNWLLSIETQPEWTMLQLSAMERAALPEIIDDDEPAERPALPSVVDPFDEEEMGPADVEWWDESAEETGFQGCDSLDDFLYQLNQDFDLTEVDARNKLKELGYSSWPKNGGAREKSKKMYLAVKASVGTEG